MRGSSVSRIVDLLTKMPHGGFSLFPAQRAELPDNVAVHRVPCRWRHGVKKVPLAKSFGILPGELRGVAEVVMCGPAICGHRQRRWQGAWQQQQPLDLVPPELTACVDLTGRREDRGSDVRLF